MTPPPFWVVIPAAGIGKRMEADRPKQYLELAGRTLLEHTLDCFLDHPALKGLVLCLAEDDPWWPALRGSASPAISHAVGGAERADTVLAGLLRLHELGAAQGDWVLVHDAARPNLSRYDFDLLLSTLADDPVGGLLGVPSRDTLKRVGEDGLIAGEYGPATLRDALAEGNPVARDHAATASAILFGLRTDREHA